MPPIAGPDSGTLRMFPELGPNAFPMQVPVDEQVIQMSVVADGNNARQSVAMMADVVPGIG